MVAGLLKATRKVRASQSKGAGETPVGVILRKVHRNIPPDFSGKGGIVR